MVIITTTKKLIKFYFKYLHGFQARYRLEILFVINKFQN